MRMIPAISRDRYVQDSSVALRIGLGVVILLAGLHKLAEPARWVPYLAPLFAVRWPISIKPTMVVFGLSERPIGICLVINRYTAVAAFHIGQFIGIIIRDLAVFILATGVAIRSAVMNTS